MDNEILPCFYAAVILYFPTDTPMEELRKEFGNNCSFWLCKDFDSLEVKICYVDNIKCWEVAEVLELLFEKCDIERIKLTTKKFNGSVFIDISFTHDEKYPALIFDGQTMQIIHELQAGIGIDAY